MELTPGRVAVVFRHFGPYHLARVKAAADLVDTIAVQIFGDDPTYSWDNGLPGGVKTVTLFPNAGMIREQPAKSRAKLRQALDAIAPSATAIPGWADPISLWTLEWCIENGSRAVLMSESQRGDFRRNPVSEALKRRIVCSFDAAIVGGNRHADYLAELGMPESRIATGYDVIDNSYFQRAAAEARRAGPELRRKHDLPEHYFLASCRLIEKKNLFQLIRAFAQFHADPANADWHLVILGNGPLHDSLKQAAAAAGLSEKVQFPGFRQYDELPIYYGLASAFVHASTVEQWGLVVNEAMASGLPVLVSRNCGCVDELVHDGVNGYAFDPSDAAALSARMQELAADPALRASFGRESERIIAPLDSAAFGRGIHSAVAFAGGAPAKSRALPLLLRGLARMIKLQ